LRSLVLPLATSVLFSGSYVAGKLVAGVLDPLDATLARYLVALLVLAALIPRFGASTLRVLPRDLPRLVALGLTGIVGYHLLFFASLRHTTAGNTAIINALGPVLTALAAAALLGERLGRRAYLGVAVACFGTLALVTDGDPGRLTALDLNRGDLLMLAAVLCWVGYSLLLRSLLGRYGGFALTFHATLTGVLTLGLLTADANTWGELSRMSGATLAAIVYMGALASGVGYLLYSFSVETIGPTRTSAFVYCTVPVLVAFLALLTLGEPVTGVMVASIALVLVGLRLLHAG
jgi:drug/metabolite transporter (DMT)-like permease